jgi:ABC-2 type transport system ATP-binding protein
VIFGELEGVTKSFGRTRALTGASFRISAGEVVAVLGPNGAGKTTALSVLLGLRRPDSGTVRLFGSDPTLPGSRDALGVTPQETAFPATLRVRELVALVRAHYPRPLAAEVVYERFGLGAFVSRQLGGLSGGQRRRVAVALAFAGGARLVVLDEPTTGLDPDARHAVWDAVRSHGAAGGAVLLTTHHLEEADSLAGRVVLLEAGVVVADGPVGQVKAAAGLTVVRFRASSGLEIEGAERDGAHLRLLTPDGGKTVEELVRTGVPLVDLEVRPLTLEEALEARGALR